MKQKYKAYYHSEIGLLEIEGTDQAIIGLKFVEALNVKNVAQDQANPPPIIMSALAQLEEYFKGKRQNFSLNLEPEGTDFQKAVQRQLTNIPYGQTVSYLDIAKCLGNEKAVRAVGQANGHNKISIMIPCHRVIGNDGQLTGYGGGLWRKAWLLRHEGVTVIDDYKVFQ